MNQTTFSFPQIVNRNLRKIDLSSNTKSINECLGILLRTRPRRNVRRPGLGLLPNRQSFQISRCYSGTTN